MVRKVDSCNNKPHRNITSTAPPRRKRTANNTGTWFSDEDERLKEAVAKRNTRWVEVAAEVGTRNSEQCAKRWNSNVNPNLHHGFWSAEEDKLLLHLVGLHGHAWKFITDNFLQTRASLSIKNRYSTLMRRQTRQNIKLRQQQHQSSTASHGKMLPSSMDTSLSSSSPSSSSSNAQHPPSNSHLIAINPGNPSNSPSFLEYQGPAVSESSSHSSTNSVSSPLTGINSDALGEASYAVDLFGFFPNTVPTTLPVQGDSQEIETQFTFSGAEETLDSCRHPSDNTYHRQGQDNAYAEWEDFEICSDDVSFSDLLGSTNLFITPRHIGK